MPNEKIFIQIAAYRDLELPKTIKSAIENAKHPENLTFGIINQFDSKTRGILSAFKQNSQFRIIEEPWYRTNGVGDARCRCGKLYAGEKWTLQIDSHSRFGGNWDERLIAEWRRCNDEKAILSTYPPEFRYDDNNSGKWHFTNYQTTQMYIKELWQSIPKLASRRIAVPDAHVMGYLTAGGFQFAPGMICKDIPYIKEIWFFGEEAVRSLQFFTHGYNVYIPNDLPVFHLYNRLKVAGDDAHYLWQDIHEGPLRERYDKGTIAGYKIAQDLLLDRSHTNVRYLGTVRTHGDFYDAIGVQLVNSALELKSTQKT